MFIYNGKKGIREIRMHWNIIAATGCSIVDWHV
jgi:hypothetical protein